MDLSEIGNFSSLDVEDVWRKGIAEFGQPDPISYPAWAEKHFYLSRESSYGESRWKAWPFQLAIMACMANDDIEEVDVEKSARVGYTKMFLGLICYNAHHRRRNQAVWQPTDDDRDVSIHAPARGATIQPLPRSAPHAKFQSTRPRGARQQLFERS